MPPTTSRRRKPMITTTTATSGPSSASASSTRPPIQTSSPSSPALSSTTRAALTLLLAALLALPPEDAAFEVQDLPGRGKGLIATRDIEQGELIIREAPLLLVPPETTNPIGLLHERVAALSADQRATFFALSHVHLDPNADDYIKRLPLVIFETNAVAAGRNVGLFPRMARLNHGCAGAFNVVYSWRESDGVLLVHTLRRVAKGEELLTTYTNTKRPRAERRAYLRQQYDFNCTCAVCSLPPHLSQQSDDRLVAMADAHAKLAQWGRGEMDGPAAVALVRQIWELGEQEGYWSERGALASDAAHVACAHSDIEAARAWAATAVHWYRIELGAGAPQVEENEQLARNPRVHRSWGTRTIRFVGGPARA